MARKTAKKKNIMTLKGKTNLFKNVFKLMAKAYATEVCKAEGSGKITFYDTAFVYYCTCDLVYRIANEYTNEINEAGKNAEFEVYLDLAYREIGFTLNSKNKVNGVFDYNFMYFPEDRELINIISDFLEDDMDNVLYWLNEDSNLVSEENWKSCKSILDSIDTFKTCLKETLKRTLKGE